MNGICCIIQLLSTSLLIHSVLSSYTIVNHNDPSALGTELIYEPFNLVVKLIDTIADVFAMLQ